MNYKSWICLTAAIALGTFLIFLYPFGDPTTAIFILMNYNSIWVFVWLGFCIFLGICSWLATYYFIEVPLLSQIDEEDDQ